MTRKCTRCCVEMNKLDTIYLSTLNRALPSLPLFAYECPNCHRIELVKVTQ